PPAGIALATLWLARPALWPGVWLGAAAANFTVDGALAAAAAIATGNTLEALAGAWLARRAFGDRRGPFSQVRHVFHFFALALACAAIGAAVGAAVLHAYGGVDAASLHMHWITWWLGDATGMVIFAPLIAAWARRARFALTPRRTLELAVLSAGVAAVTFEVFHGVIFGAAALPATFLLAPFVIWAAIRFGMREVSALCAVVAGIAVAASVTQRGPFGEQSANVSLLLQQAFVSTLVVTGLVLVALMHELRRMSETLRRANEEMEQMLHLAAHDLQEPLRTVVNFSDLLSRRHGAGLDADANELLGFVTGAASRARRLIQDLLDLAETRRRPLVLEPVSSAAALDDALDTLRGAIEESGAQVSRGELPQVRADRRMLVSLLQNLVGNAVKYRSAAPPQVAVGAVRRGDEWVFSVRDNGAGIDPRYHQSVFRMFERLQRGGRDGTGSGLALCKRIVERHGGRLWLESAAAQGATFHFSLPAEERNHGH
ncbi:MAG: MASE1 domain-containing protein, partial [Betaproteobacteria bacterium]